MANKRKEEETTTVDKLNANLGSASEKIAQNKKVIFWVVGGVAVIAAFVLSYLFIYRNPRLNRAFEAYNEVELTSVGNDSVTAGKYSKVADEFGGTNAGKLAALSAAEVLYGQGKYKEALEQLDKFSTSEPILASNALILKGDCYVNTKAYDKAIECYKKAVKKADDNPQIVPRTLIKMANVYDEQKKYDDALDCYEEILENYPNFKLGNGLNIEAYIEREKARTGK